MVVKVIAPVLASLFVLGAFASCKNGEKTPPRKSAVQSSAARPQSWAPKRTAEIYFTTGSLGYVEPCGCTSTPLGGVQRLATIIKSASKARLLIDAGNLLFPKDALEDTTREQHEFKAEILARMYRKLGVSAINLGGSDVSAGTDFLRALQREGAVPLVSANIRPVKEKGPMVARSYLRKIGGLTIGITGVAKPSKFKKMKNLQGAPWGDALAQEIQALEKDGAELLIVLADLGAADSEDLARKHPSIDFVLRSYGTEITRKPAGPKRVGKVIIIEAGSQGQYVGRLTLAFGPHAPSELQFDDGGYAAERKRELLRRKIDGLKREIEAWRGDKKKQAAVKARKTQLQQFEKRLLAISSTKEISGPYAAYKLIPLTQEVESDPDTDMVLKSITRNLKR
jgi:2',3'-cyclic-nucleotide 2'-phosphodiesterase (5'-nucleotidase family)